MKSRSCIGFTILLFAIVVWSSPQLQASADCSATLSSKDTAAIRKVIDAYRTGWLQGDAKAVQTTFDDQAVLIPHHGDRPVVGIVAIREYWWPKDTPATRIVRLDITYDEIGGDSCFAFVRGNDSVEWIVTTSAGEEKYGNAGTYLNVMRKQPDGAWRILQHMWDDPANQRR